VARLYGELSGWWPAISPPSEYAEEAALYVEMILAAHLAPGGAALVAPDATAETFSPGETEHGGG
jgi:hypothetical protein